jgi:hypothetical protein
MVGKSGHPTAEGSTPSRLEAPIAKNLCYTACAFEEGQRKGERENLVV